MVSAADKLYARVQSAQFLGPLAADLLIPKAARDDWRKVFLAVLQVVAVHQAVTMGAPVLGLLPYSLTLVHDN